MYKVYIFLGLLIAETFSLAQINWSRPKVRETHPGSFEGFINTPEEFRKFRRRVDFDACHIRAGKSGELFHKRRIRHHWLIFKPSKSLENESLIYEEVNAECNWDWQAPRDGNYTVQLQIEDADTDEILGDIRTKFFVKDLWFVVMGDSYPSGQGNPDMSAKFFGIVPAKWIDPSCFRSSKSFSYKTYEKLEQKYPAYGIAFTFLACSGASIVHGLLDCFSSHVPQLTVLDRLLNESRKECSYHCQQNYTQDFCPCMFGPDAILLGIGGNDIEYGKVATAMFLGNPYQGLHTN